MTLFFPGMILFAMFEIRQEVRWPMYPPASCTDRFSGVFLTLSGQSHCPLAVMRSISCVSFPWARSTSELYRKLRGKISLPPRLQPSARTYALVQP